MRERKTDDQEILRLLQEGKSQKQIAEHFGVSPVAIHKRIKRLAPPPDMPHFNQLTDKEKKFVLGKVEGKSNIQAVMQSHDVTSKESAKSMASQLMGKTLIQMSLDELMEYCGIDKPYRIRRLKQIIDSSDLSIVHKGLDMSFKLDGSYAPEKHLIYSLNFVREIAGDLNELLEKLQECKEEPLA
ncbi:MAG: AsnC family protein, partial [bacterium]